MGHYSDAFTKGLDDAVTNKPRKLKCADDTLFCDYSIAKVLWHAYGSSEMCGEKGITLRSDTFPFCKCNISRFRIGLGL